MTTTDPLDMLIDRCHASGTSTAPLDAATAAVGNPGVLFLAERLRALEQAVKEQDDPTRAGAQIERVMWLLIDAGEHALRERIVGADAEREMREALAAAAGLGFTR